MLRRLGFALVLATASSAPSLAVGAAPAPTQFPSDAAVQALLDRRVDDEGAVGLVVGLLASDGSTRILHAGAAGEGVEPLGAASLFQIGSVSKVLTGTLLADMAGRGEVSLADPIDAYLPEGVTLPAEARGAITLGDLATHRSGLPHLPEALPMETLSDPYAGYTVEALFASVSRLAPPPVEQRRFRYSNLGIGLLGQLLASHLGLGWEEAVRQRVLAPLEMTGTGLGPDAVRGATATKGHDLGGLEVPPWDFGALAAAGGAHSTTRDLLRFLAANVGEPRTDLEQAMRMAHHPRARLDHDWTVGLTWMVRSVGHRRTVWHSGAAGGYRAFLGFDPDREIGVVVLANSGPGIDDLGFHLLNPAVPLDPPRLPRNAARDEVPIPTDELERYEGDYFVLPGAPLRIRVEHGRLWAMVPGQGPHPAYGDGQGGFFLRAADVELRFGADGSGEIAFAVLRRGGDTVRALRIADRMAENGGR